MLSRLQTLVPSQGDLPPPGGTFPLIPQPPILELCHPTEDEIHQDPDSKLVLPESWSMKARWNSLCTPPDKVATKMATEGLMLKFHSRRPPLCPKDSPPLDVITNNSQIQPLSPIVDDWLERDILTKDAKRIPQFVHFSRMFHVSKKAVPGLPDKIRPVFDLSKLNKFIKTPPLKMEHIGKILPMLTQVLWGSSLDISDAFLSVAIFVTFQKYFCFVLNGTVYMFLRMPFGLTTAPWAFSCLMRSVPS